MLNPTDTVLVLGHSHVENAIVDLPYPADQIINLGASGEDYFYTYLKAKALLSSANNITHAYIWTFGGGSFCLLPASKNGLFCTKNRA